MKKATIFLAMLLGVHLLLLALVFADDGTEKFFKIAKDENTIGSPQAKVTVIEYSSVTCPHCAHFHKEIFPKFKQEYIDTGKVRYVYRDFPLDKIALSGAMMAHCSREKYFTILNSLFESQSSWITGNTQNEKFIDIAKLQGLKPEELNACFKDDKLKDFLVERSFEAAKALKIEGTPTFFINGEKLVGFKNYEYFTSMVDKQLAPPAKPL